MKKPIDIQNLVEWAINDELPKNQPVMRDISVIIANYVTVARPKMAFAFEKYFDRASGGFLSGDPHPDAIIVVRAIEALRAKDDGEYKKRVSLASKTDARLILGDLVEIDNLCADVAMSVSVCPATTVLSCAILRRPPPLDNRMPRPMPIRRHSGRPLMQREDVDGNLVEATMTWKASRQRPSDFYGNPRCPIEWGDPRPEDIAEQRTEYTIWHKTMAQLAATLKRTLTDHIPNPPARPAMPWMHASRGNRVLSSLLRPEKPSGQNLIA